ncbi:MAG: [protein-PII] uridylyltransferase [Gammaproteobacteria bacterium]|nr:[protein-PII] uridylyltransferase [Gammaproteobacteria bacterium]
MKRVFNGIIFDQALSHTENPLALFRNTLAQGAETLEQGFRDAVPVSTLISLRAKLIDSLLQRAWQRNMPEDTGAALVAVGGYGRGELHPSSDIDLMILVEADERDRLTENLEQLLTFLWDIGLEVGHSVRSIAECVEEAKQDITVTTNVMESRLLAGNQNMLRQMREATSPDKIWPSDQFFQGKWEEQKARYDKFDDSATNLEPNLKEGPGGLRDIQTVGWVAKRYFGCDTMHGLVGHNFLTEMEYESLMEGRSLMWKIRFALHLLTGRREDRLLFDYQRALAQEFGFVDQEHSLAVEQFMQRYYRTAIRIERLNERLLQLFEEAILLENQPAEILTINERFQARNGFLEVSNDNIFKHYPFALLEIFLLLQLYPELKGVRASTVRLIRSHRHLIDDQFRENPRAKSLFMEIIRQSNGVTSELRRMNRYGILSAYLPVFSNIVGRMQYDLFHVYTVDEHTLFVVRNLRRFAVASRVHEFPLCSDIISRQPKPELLYLAGLFHDIAKGRQGDHSTLGAKDARDFCNKHDLSDYDSKLVTWLVKNHLLMSMTAQRQDTSDPDVIYNFAKKMGTITRLDHLYLLTVSDTRATDPKKWNSWKDSLLKDLYTATMRAMLRGLERPNDINEQIQEKQHDASEELQRAGVSTDEINNLWTTLGVEYFLYSSVEEIVSHTQFILTNQEHTGPQINLRSKTGRGGSEVVIYSQDRKGLFAVTTALLDRLCLNVVDARIETTSNAFSLDSYRVLEDDGSAVTDRDREQKIIKTLKDGLNNPDQVNLSVARRIPRQQKHFQTPTQIDFSQDPANQRTILKLITVDQPGLLAQVGHAFGRCGVNLKAAKIATIGAEAEDTFFITGEDKKPIEDPDKLQCLHNSIMQQLESGD